MQLGIGICKLKILVTETMKDYRIAVKGWGCWVWDDGVWRWWDVGVVWMGIGVVHGGRG